MTVLRDGLEELLEVVSLTEVMSQIEHTARWAAPETFALLPVWYPEYARGAQFYNANWTQQRMNRNRTTGVTAPKTEVNSYAAQALTYALGLRRKDRPNWSCCHIWGVDDPKFQVENSVVKDRRYYSCIANMVLLPTPLKAYTDALSQVKFFLRHCAEHLYGWRCDHPEIEHVAASDNEVDWAAYPPSWPTRNRPSRPMGTVDLTKMIELDAHRRLQRIRADLRSAGEHYPRDDVRAALDYWGVSV